MSEAIAGVREYIARSSTPPLEQQVEAKSETETAPKAPCNECAEKAKEAQAEAAQQKRRFFIFDEETGEKIPAVWNSEGKEYVPETVDQIQTWTGLGIHAGERLKGIKEREAFLKQNEGVVKQLVEAMRDGRLSIKGEDFAPAKTPQAPGMTLQDEPEDELVTDPAILRHRAEIAFLKKKSQDLESAVGTLTKLYMNKEVKSEETKIRNEMASLQKDYPLAYKRQQDVWALLAQQGEDGSLTYNVQSAMQKVNSELIQGFREFIKEHPEFIERDKIKTEGVQQYLAEKSQKEESPVASPSGTPVVANTAEPMKPKTLHEAAVKIASFLQSKQEQGKKL